MESKEITIDCNGLPMRFAVEEYDDHVVLVRYLSKQVSELVIPDEINGKPVTEIDKICFCKHPEINEIVFSDNLVKIGDQAFALCSGITKLHLPDSITEIGYFAFRDCTGLREIIMPANLKRLQTGTFSFCYLPDTVKIVLKEGLEVIEPKIFSSGGLPHFFTLEIPSTVKTIAKDAFDYGIKLIFKED